MRLIYFDEVKYHPPRQPAYWIGALSIDFDAIPRLEALCDALAQDFFGTRRLGRETEFHAVDMIHGVGNFKKREISQRLDALSGLLKVADDESIRKISIKVRPDLMIARPETAGEKAFVFLVEKVQHDLEKVRSTGMMIGDLDTDYADQSVSNLSLFREKGTPYFFGRTIDRIVDSVYFIPSHHSRMIQLADAYTYSLQLLDSPPDKDNYPKKTIRDFLRKETKWFGPNSYRDWPSNDSWARLHAA